MLSTNLRRKLKLISFFTLLNTVNNNERYGYVQSDNLLVIFKIFYVSDTKNNWNPDTLR